MMSLLLSGAGRYMRLDLSFYNNFFLHNNWEAFKKEVGMSRCSRRTSIVGAIAITAVSAAFPASAAPSTSQGLVSVAQVVQMLDEAPADRTAQQVLTAYLAGVGEAAGAVLHMGGVSCKAAPGLSAIDARHAIGTASSDPAESPATPLIVRDMLDRAGCRAR